VFVTDQHPDAIVQVAHDLSAAGGLCQGLAADVTRAEQVARVIRRVAAATGGRIDIIVNVAGVVGQGKVETLDEAEWDRIFAVNCKGSFLLIRQAVPLMKARRYGRIINFSSKSGKTGSALMSHYSAAKAAIIGLTQALACELADNGITVNCLCPGITENTGVWNYVSSAYASNLGLSMDQVTMQFTAKVPLRRLARVEDVTAVALFLASPAADYMTGQAINVTGGREMH
jgi:NAD(P)-dependent dehydrogenase (short-subunit alcohol dehydrogenase family)